MFSLPKIDALVSSFFASHSLALARMMRDGGEVDESPTLSLDMFVVLRRLSFLRIHLGGGGGGGGRPACQPVLQCQIPQMERHTRTVRAATPFAAKKLDFWTRITRTRFGIGQLEQKPLRQRIPVSHRKGRGAPPRGLAPGVRFSRKNWLL